MDRRDWRTFGSDYRRYWLWNQGWDTRGELKPQFCDRSGHETEPSLLCYPGPLTFDRQADVRPDSRSYILLPPQDASCCAITLDQRNPAAASDATQNDAFNSDAFNNASDTQFLDNSDPYQADSVSDYQNDDFGSDDFGNDDDSFI